MTEQFIDPGEIEVITLRVGDEDLKYPVRMNCGSTPDVCNHLESLTTPSSKRTIDYCRMRRGDNPRRGLVCGKSSNNLQDI